MRAPWHAIARRPAALLGHSLLCAALLSACGGGVEQEKEKPHENTTLNTAGRLALAEKDAKTLRLHDLDSGSIEASHTLEHVPAAVYPSPSGRHAVVMQRLQDQVQFVDGGIWQEDHGDHLHDYKQGSKLLAWKLAGVRPTHYDLQAGQQAAIFMDGNSATTPAQNAGVRLITETSIAAGSTVASLDLSAPLHGLTEPVGTKLLVTSRAADAADTLPTHLTLYQRNGSGYVLDRQIPTRCNGLHGSFSSGSSTVAGCSNGMLLVKHTGASTVDNGQLISTALRVGTLAGHPRLPDQFIGIATEGVGPAVVTTRFYALNGSTGAVGDFTPQSWEAGRVRRAHAFDRSGQRFFILDDQGTLIVAQRSGGAWTNLARIAAALPAMPTSAPWPALIANGAKDEMYLTDPVARQLVTLNSQTGAVVSRRDLGFVPAYAAWLGITR